MHCILHGKALGCAIIFPGNVGGIDHIETFIQSNVSTFEAVSLDSLGLGQDLVGLAKCLHILIGSDLVQSNPTAKSMLQDLQLPEITDEMIDECFAGIPIEINRNFVKAFILNGQCVVRKIISEEPSEDETEQDSFDLTL